MMNVAVVLTATLVATVAAQEGTLTLKYASVIFCHGARSPVGTYPNDPYKEEDWPQGYGQLNWNGTQQQYHLGRLIRKRYTEEHQLINARYTRSEVYVRSTDYDRTLMSALSQLSGLFPPEENQKINMTIDWHPIPVHTVDGANERLLLPGRCPRNTQLFIESGQTDYFKQVHIEHQEFLRNVEKETGVSNLNALSYDVIYIADAVNVQQQWGRNPGSWVNATVSKTLQNFTGIFWQLFLQTNNALEKQRLSAGNLVGEIVERMKNKTVNNKSLIPGTNLVLYSGLDLTIITFLSALQIYDGIQPTYAATIFVELYCDSNSDYFVRLWYLNKNTIDGFDLTNTTSLLMPLQIPNCNELCPLDKFMQLTAHMVPSDYEKECQIKQDCSVTMINGSISYSSKRSRATLLLSSDGDPKASYKCRLDGRKFKNCKNRTVWKNIKRGKHTIAVRAFCINDEGERYSTMRKNFKFQI